MVDHSGRFDPGDACSFRYDSRDPFQFEGLPLLAGSLGRQVDAESCLASSAYERPSRIPPDKPRYRDGRRHQWIRDDLKAQDHWREARPQAYCSGHAST